MIEGNGPSGNVRGGRYVSEWNEVLGHRSLEGSLYKRVTLINVGAKISTLYQEFLLNILSYQEFRGSIRKKIKNFAVIVKTPDNSIYIRVQR
jgi:hypothetical protein